MARSAGAVMSTRPRISVVIASHNARASVAECLESLAGQASREAVEILVVDNSTDGTTALITERLGSAKLIRRPPDALIPELWAAGIRASVGEIVTLTTAHCVPAPDWIDEIGRAHRVPGVAVGGAIENHPAGSRSDWAVYFCRYSAYMPPFTESETEDIPGDNASYKRADIEACPDAWRDGFWEPAVHRRLRQAGVELRLSPSIVVRHRRSFDFLGFMRQRFAHGRRFGSWRVADSTGPRRWLRALVTPGVPVVLLLRIARRVFTKRRHRAQLVGALPFLGLFLGAWAFGELVGVLRRR